MNNLQSIQNLTERFVQFLEGLGEEQFNESPEPGVWSYAELYSHIFQSNIGSLIAIERCLHGSKATRGKPTLAGRAILFFGFFPGLRFRAPAQIAGLAVKTSIEDARNQIIRFKEKLLEVAPLVRKAPPDNAIKHPRLGMLNASQWLRFIEIHTAHHYKQLERISNLLTRR